MAVDLLLKAVDANHDDPIKDLIGCYKRGDIVAVEEGGFLWGSEEDKPPANGGKFVIVTITDKTKAQALKYIENAFNSELTVIRRRLFRLIVSELPLSVRNQLNTTGRYSATWVQVRNFIENKLSLVRET